MSATARGIRKLKAWMAFVKSAGWPESTWGRLVDLWWEHHDDNGELKP